VIRSLTGIIKEIGDNEVVVDVRGVGYLVATPTLTNPYSKDESIHLYTYLAVRETAMDLYGFRDKTELEMFQLLLGIPKIGPKSALQIMTQATPALLVEAAEKHDGQFLHKLSGIGKKTAENIVEYLHKKLDLLPTATSATDTNSSLTQVQTDAIDALIALGYEASTAREVITGFSEEDATVNSLVTKALKQI
jgi:Holliday junction DNA helicase RuvA